MERLTKMLRNGSVVCRLKFEKPSSCDDDCGKCLHDMKAWNKLAEYEELEEQGLLLLLPCRPHEIVWVGRDKHNLHKTMYVSASGIIDDIEDGWVIRRTKEEVETALKEMEK